MNFAVHDGGVAADHANVFRAEDVAEGKAFLVGEGFDRDGVVGAAALAEGFGLEGEDDERFSGAAGGVEDDIGDVVRGAVFGEVFAAERGGD